MSSVIPCARQNSDNTPREPNLTSQLTEAVRADYFCGLEDPRRACGNGEHTSSRPSRSIPSRLKSSKVIGGEPERAMSYQHTRHPQR